MLFLQYKNIRYVLNEINKLIKFHSLETISLDINDYW